jgi:hypothetical protein
LVDFHKVGYYAGREEHERTGLVDYLERYQASVRQAHCACLADVRYSAACRFPVAALPQSFP